MREVVEPGQCVHGSDYELFTVNGSHHERPPPLLSQLNAGALEHAGKDWKEGRGRHIPLPCFPLLLPFHSDHAPR